MRYIHISGLLSLLLLGVGLTAAQDASTSSQQAPRHLLDNLAKALPEGLNVAAIVASPANGLYQAELSDGSFIYVTDSGRYFVLGDLYKIQPDGLVNVTESKARATRRLAIIRAVDERDMIVFAPDAKTRTKAKLTVFTDVDCGYCQKFHRDVPTLNKHGVEVRYLAFPRAGPDSHSADKMITAWCSKNRQAALTQLKRGTSMANRSCANPVKEQYQLGVRIGIHGTPALINEQGVLLPGYVPAEKLLAWLGI